MAEAQLGDIGRSSTTSSHLMNALSNSRAGELHHADVILKVTLPAGDDPARIVAPGEKAFDLPRPLPRVRWREVPLIR
jgi:hypothetical protein